MDWNVVIAFGTVAAAAVTGAVAFGEWQRRRQGAKESNDDRLERLELMLAGKGPDPQTNMPAIPGFFDEMRAFRLTVEKQLTLNGGGSLRDEVAAIKDTMAKVKADVEGIKGRLP